MYIPYYLHIISLLKMHEKINKFTNCNDNNIFKYHANNQKKNHISRDGIENIIIAFYHSCEYKLIK